ncbi:hypothetical protein FQA39_LY11125 [Lamprigera yunnana]|nr:hypothetical protein FQA39_LY11125 [Lamprigera yunnana]
MYNLGQRFRKNYYRYLGFQYKPQLVLAMSSGHSRTTASLELFLAGLFPPLNTPLEWNSNLNWNPIQFKCDTGSESNKLFFSIWCPSFKKVFDAYLDSKYVQNLEGKYRKDYAYLSNSTGLNVQSLAQLSQLYFGLTSEKEWGFELPTWTNEFYPSYLQEAAIDNYKTLIATPEHNQLYGGPLLKNIIDHLNNTITDSLENPKIIVYSGHEINIVGLLSAMKVYNPHVPPYGACIVLELYDNDAVKVLYDDYTSSDFKELKIEGCESPCPFSAFVNLLKAHLPSDENTCMV